LFLFVILAGALAKPKCACLWGGDLDVDQCIEAWRGGGLWAAKLSPNTKDNAKQKPRNLHCNRPALAGSGIACCWALLFQS